jgi:hypothetical protein
MNQLNNLTKILPLLIFPILLLTGCGFAFESNRADLLKTAKIEDYGPKPPPDFVKQEEDLIKDSLKDPDSAEFRDTNGIPTIDIIQSAFASPKPMLVWVHFLEVNAKNSYGGYVGYEPYKFAWRTNRIVAYVSPDNPDFWTYLNNK